MDGRIDRPEYMKRLIEYRDTDVVKIITGIRRCGKSTLLDLFGDYLLGVGVRPQSIIHINFESLRFRDLSGYIALYEYVSARIVPGAKAYLLFDEIQMVADWERAIESFRLDFDVDIYITGSNAYMLSSEFATLLSGRYVEIRMLPLSFKEFLLFNEFAGDVSMEARFQRYLQFGGMPVLGQFRFNERRCFEALEGIYNTVIMRDVLERNRSADGALLHKIVLFLCGNIGSITSPNSIGNVLSGEGEIKKGKKGFAGKDRKGIVGEDRKGFAGKTVGRYMQMLKNAFVFYPVGRYDVKAGSCSRRWEKATSSISAFGTCCWAIGTSTGAISLRTSSTLSFCAATTASISARSAKPRSTSSRRSHRRGFISR